MHMEHNGSKDYFINKEVYWRKSEKCERSKNGDNSELAKDLMDRITIDIEHGQQEKLESRHRQKIFGDDHVAPREPKHSSTAE